MYYIHIVTLTYFLCASMSYIIMDCVLTDIRSLKCDDYEHMSCMKVVQLRSQEAVSGMKNFIAVSTCDTKTDEVYNIVYSVIDSSIYIV